MRLPVQGPQGIHRNLPGRRCQRPFHPLRRRPSHRIRNRKDSAQGRAGSYHPGAHHREGEADAHITEARLHDYQPAHRRTRLNPSNNGEESCGPEEASIIIPAIDQLAEQKIQAFGPYPADEFFGNGHFVEFDGIMTMYHDQATTPFHSLYTEDGVLFTAGLPLVHTAANTTPSYSITGCNEADAISFRHAIYLALDAFCNREDYDEAYENPLPKLYHEKRDESEKVRFSIPKKKG